jgi:hypothetical protein
VASSLTSWAHLILSFGDPADLLPGIPMSIDSRPLREAPAAPAPASVLTEVGAPTTAAEAKRLDGVATATLIAHAVERAEARLERLRDELDRVQAIAGRDDELDVDQIRLLAAVAEAERERDACRSLAAASTSDLTAPD